MLTALALFLVATPILMFGYAYVGYPLLLKPLAALRRRGASAAAPRAAADGAAAEWPTITITLPVYNEERSIASAIDSLLAIDYPADRRQVLVISDCSSDRTDDIVRSYADRGVELVRLAKRGGKTAAENAAGPAARGEIIVNTDATTRIPKHALKELVRAFQDPTVGVASGRDVSAANASAAAGDGRGGEAGYVGYEMWVRSLETQVGSIVGASGCFYGIRRQIYDSTFPEALSRDFASALLAREAGYRAVSVDAAICIVPRTSSLQAEFRRKIRTMARGLETLWYKRHLMNPATEGAFAFMLISHKLCRWLVYVTLPLAMLGLVILATQSWIGAALLGLTALGALVGWAGLRMSAKKELPSLIALPSFVFAANLAGLLAWVKVFRGQHNPVWEPTRRPV
ncbi:MAG TPA: glycosyltransferase [Gemmatimonadaceae bacterium]|nr:glycosyltransferase [Gemmatimonadaceae bacterium]